MSERRALAPELRRFDREAADRGMPVGARTRVAERLRREAIAREATSGFRFRWLPALTFAAGAALVLLVVGLGLRPAAVDEQDPASSALLGVFSVQGEGCRYEGDAHQAVLDGTCRLVAPQMTVQTWERVVLRDDDGLHLVEGTALFEVSHVEAGEDPVQIGVSHGTIEVMGTRFTIEQGPTGGHVDLFDGRIRFVSQAGEHTEIEPGQRRAWGDAVLAEAETVDTAEVEVEADGRGSALGSLESATDELADEAETETETEVDDASEVAASERGRRKRRRSKSEPAASSSKDAEPAEAGPEDASAIIEEVSRLRAQGRFADAAAVLRRAEAERRWDRRTAQVLSYELGEIIERHLDDEARACAHWARHAERFPGGRYDAAVRAARERLGCSPEAEPAP